MSNMTGNHFLGHIRENNERTIHLNLFGITADFFPPDCFLLYLLNFPIFQVLS